MKKDKSILSDEDFCRFDSSFFGETVDNIKQIEQACFNGEELKDYVEHCIQQYLNLDAKPEPPKKMEYKKDTKGNPIPKISIVYHDYYDNDGYNPIEESCSSYEYYTIKKLLPINHTMIQGNHLSLGRDFIDCLKQRKYLMISGRWMRENDGYRTFRLFLDRNPHLEKYFFISSWSFFDQNEYNLNTIDKHSIDRDNLDKFFTKLLGKAEADKLLK